MSSSRRRREVAGAANGELIASVCLTPQAAVTRESGVQGKGPTRTGSWRLLLRGVER